MIIYKFSVFKIDSLKVGKIASSFSIHRKHIIFFSYTMMCFYLFFITACTQLQDVSPNMPSVESAPSSQEHNLTKENFSRAQSLIKSEKHIEAALLLSELVKNDPNDPLVWANYALSQYKTGNLEAALHSVDNALALQPKLESALNLKAAILIDLGKILDAESILLPAIIEYPDNPNIVYNIAILYDIYFQDASKALLYYQRYLDLVSKDAETESWLIQLKRFSSF